MTLLSKRLAVLPDMARLHTATVGLTRDPTCGATTLNLQGPFSVTNQNVANPSSFAGKVTLDDVGAGVHVVYTVSGTVRAVDGAGTAGAIAWTFTYSGDERGSRNHHGGRRRAGAHRWRDLGSAIGRASMHLQRHVRRRALSAEASRRSLPDVD